MRTTNVKSEKFCTLLLVDSVNSVNQISHHERVRTGRPREPTVRIAHLGFSFLEVAEFIDNLLDYTLQLAHLDFENRERLLICNGTAMSQDYGECSRTLALSLGRRNLLVVHGIRSDIDVQFDDTLVLSSSRSY